MNNFGAIAELMITNFPYLETYKKKAHKNE